MARQPCTPAALTAAWPVPTQHIPAPRSPAPASRFGGASVLRSRRGRRRALHPLLLAQSAGTSAPAHTCRESTPSDAVRGCPRGAIDGGTGTAPRVRAPAARPRAFSCTAVMRAATAHLAARHPALRGGWGRVTGRRHTLRAPGHPLFSQRYALLVMLRVKGGEGGGARRQRSRPRTENCAQRLPLVPLAKACAIRARPSSASLASSSFYLTFLSDCP